jgi:hypothetical protein
MEKQDMQQIIEMLAKMDADRKTDKEDLMKKLDAYQEKVAADRKADKEEMKADIKAWREKISAEIETMKAKMRAIRENMGTSHKEMVAVIEPGRNMEKIACQEMEAHPEEEKPASVDMKPEAAEQREVPVQDATAIPVVEPEKEIRSMQFETTNTRTETMACQEMEEYLDEQKPTSVDRKPEAAEEEEVPVEDAVVKPVKGRKKRHRGKKQAAE